MVHLGELQNKSHPLNSILRFINIWGIEEKSTEIEK